MRRSLTPSPPYDLPRRPTAHATTSGEVRAALPYHGSATPVPVRRILDELPPPPPPVLAGKAKGVRGARRSLCFDDRDDVPRRRFEERDDGTSGRRSAEAGPHTDERGDVAAARRSSPVYDVTVSRGGLASVDDAVAEDVDDGANGDSDVTLLGDRGDGGGAGDGDAALVCIDAGGCEFRTRVGTLREAPKLWGAACASTRRRDGRRALYLDETPKLFELMLLSLRYAPAALEPRAIDRAPGGRSSLRALAERYAYTALALHLAPAEPAPSASPAAAAATPADERTKESTRLSPARLTGDVRQEVAPDAGARALWLKGLRGFVSAVTRRHSCAGAGEESGPAWLAEWMDSRLRASPLAPALLAELVALSGEEEEKPIDLTEDASRRRATPSPPPPPPCPQPLAAAPSGTRPIEAPLSAAADPSRREPHAASASESPQHSATDGAQRAHAAIPGRVVVDARSVANAVRPNAGRLSSSPPSLLAHPEATRRLKEATAAASLTLQHGSPVVADSKRSEDTERSRATAQAARAPLPSTAPAAIPSAAQAPAPSSSLLNGARRALASLLSRRGGGRLAARGATPTPASAAAAADDDDDQGSLSSSSSASDAGGGTSSADD